MHGIADDVIHQLDEREATALLRASGRRHRVRVVVVLLTLGLTLAATLGRPRRAPPPGGSSRGPRRWRGRARGPTPRGRHGQVIAVELLQARLHRVQRPLTRVAHSRRLLRAKPGKLIRHLTPRLLHVLHERAERAYLTLAHVTEPFSAERSARVADFVDGGRENRVQDKEVLLQNVLGAIHLGAHHAPAPQLPALPLFVRAKHGEGFSLLPVGHLALPSLRGDELRRRPVEKVRDSIRGHGVVVRPVHAVVLPDPQGVRLPLVRVPVQPGEVHELIRAVRTGREVVAPSVLLIRRVRHHPSEQSQVLVPVILSLGTQRGLGW